MQRSIQASIRELREGDFSDLISNYFRRYEERRDNPHIFIGIPKEKPTFEEEAAWFANLLKEAQRGRAIASVAEVDGKVVGMCNIITKNSQDERRHVGTIGISITDGFRSLGIGTKLIEDALEKAKGIFGIINLEVYGTNQRAKKLYELLGFEVYGVLPGGVIMDDEHIDIILMYRKS